MATGTSTGPLASIKRKLDEISRQVYEIDLKVQAFKKENKDISDLLEAKHLLQQDIVSLQIDYELQKVKNKKKWN